MRLIVLLVLASLAGCLAEAPETPVDVAPPSQAVVAVIDSGVNVYHDFYQRGVSIPDEILGQFTNGLDDQPPRRIQLTQEGDYEARVEADADIWANISANELVYFEGTNVLGISFSMDDHPVLDDGSHGTGTTTSVLEANPDAIVVLVEGVGSGSGEKWAAEQSWIDILSESYGLYCGQPVLELLPGDSTARNNKLAYDSGKMVVGAADNTPCPAQNDGTAGPPWVVGVAGDHPDPEGGCREVLSGNFPDFTADFTQTLSRSHTINETRSMSGTSFSTPTTAGTFSKILLDVRTAWGHTGGIVDGVMALGPDGQTLTQDDLRHAMELVATYWDADSGCPAEGKSPVGPMPWIQMGWGHVGPEAVEPAVNYLLGGEAPTKDPQAVQYNEAQFAYRELVWGLFV